MAPQLTPLGAALAGALGGCFSNAVVYPLDVAKTRIQAASSEALTEEEKEELSLYRVLVRIMKEEGLAGWYRGFGATMLNTFSMQYAYFFFYSFVRTSYIRRVTPKSGKAPALSTAAELLIGAAAGGLAQIFTIPVSVIATRQQIGTRKAKTYAEIAAPDSDASADDSFLAVAREIVREEGVTGLWLGIKPGLVLTVNPAITYGMFERVKTVVAVARGGQPGDKLGPWLAFVVGALSKTMATVVTYPYIMAKVRIQARTADDESAREEHVLPAPHGQPHHLKGHGHVGALDILARVLRKRGVRGWYQGMSAQITKAVISQALLFMSKDLFEHYALVIMMLLHRLRR